MDAGMILQYNTPEIYILGSASKIQGLNMDDLFASPAGRELVKQKTSYKTKIKHPNNELRKTLPSLTLLSETIPHEKIPISTRKDDEDETSSSGRGDGATSKQTSCGNASLEQRRSSCENENAKKTNEAYYEDELALLLGLNCMLEDDCRCLDCQSSYFDYDDDDDLDDLENYSSIAEYQHHSSHTNMYCCIQ